MKISKMVLSLFLCTAFFSTGLYGGQSTNWRKVKGLWFDHNPVVFSVDLGGGGCSKYYVDLTFGGIDKVAELQYQSILSSMQMAMSGISEVNIDYVMVGTRCYINKVDFRSVL